MRIHDKKTRPSVPPARGARRFVLVLGLALLIGSIAADSTAFQTGISDADILTLGQASAPQDRTVTPPASTGALLARLTLSLAAVFGLIFLVTWLAKKYLPAQVVAGRKSPIEVISTRAIAPRKSLVLVRVYEKTVLLAMTPQSLQFLTDIDHGRGGWEEAAVNSGMPPAAVTLAGEGS